VNNNVKVLEHYIVFMIELFPTINTVDWCLKYYQCLRNFRHPQTVFTKILLSMAPFLLSENKLWLKSFTSQFYVWKGEETM